MGLILFILSTLGYIVALTSFLKINWRSTILLSFALNSLIIFFFALFNQLNLGMMTSFILGLVSLFLAIYRFFREKISPKALLEFVGWPDLIFLVFLSIYIISMSSDYFLHYDDYSHWALMIKHLYTQNSLPSVQNGVGTIYHLTYPPITAIFINYFIQFIGYGPSQMILGQLLLIFSTYFSFSVIFENKKISFPQIILLILLFGLLQMFPYSIESNGMGLRNFSVDYLIPIVGASLVFHLNRYKDQLAVVGLLNIILGSFITLMKNSGLFFTIIGIIYSLYFIKGKFEFKKILLTVFSSIVTFLPFVCWNLYSQQFKDFSVTKHAMTLENYKNVFSEKSPEVISDIVKNYILSFLDVTSIAFRDTIYLFVFSVIIFTILYLVYKNFTFIKVYLINVAIYLSYLIGILLMFIFSMPTNEAVYLIGLPRYLMSINVYVMLIYVMFILKQTQQSINSENKLCMTPIYVIIFISHVPYLLYNNHLLMQKPQENYAQKIYENIGEIMELDDAKYLILDDLKTDKNNANGYHREVASYMLFSRNIKFITEDSLTPEDIDNYDYIAVIEYNDYTKSLLKNNHFSDSIDAVGLHKLH